MPILPPLKAMFDAQNNAPPLPADVAPAQLREMIHGMMEQSFFAFSTRRAPVDERDISIPVDGGKITLRVYRPEVGKGALPCHIYYHGGGFFLGTLDQSNDLCRGLVSDLDCMVIAVDYRLAPEFHFPTAPNDAYAALCWVADHAVELGIDLTRVSVGGASAGGNLAAVVSQMARDRKGPVIVAQVLEIPVTDFTSERELDFAEENIHIDCRKSYSAIYLGDESDARNPLASPLLAETFEALPPALVMCAEYDQLQPEGEAYAKRLVEAGVPTIYRCCSGQFHGSQGFDKLIPAEVSAYRAEIISFLRNAYEATK